MAYLCWMFITVCVAMNIAIYLKTRRFRTLGMVSKPGYLKEVKIMFGFNKTYVLSTTILLLVTLAPGVYVR